MMVYQTVSKNLEKPLLSLFDAVMAQQPESFPERPQELIDYDNMTADKKRETDEWLFKIEAIKEYLDIKWKAELANRVNFIYLYEMLSSGLPLDKHEEVLKKLTLFKDAILDNKTPFKSLCLDFRKYPFRETREKADWSNEEN